MLDAGCDHSLIGSKLIPDHILTNTDLQLRAANGTPIPLVGATRLQFTIDNVPLSAQVAVTYKLDEFLLGSDQLAQDECRWDFGSSLVQYRGGTMPTRRRPCTQDGGLPCRYWERADRDQGRVSAVVTRNASRQQNSKTTLALPSSANVENSRPSR